MDYPYPTRIISLEGAFNKRDLGGLPTQDGQQVRTGQLFRADSLHSLTDADLDTLTTLGIRTVLDLRSENELRHYGRARLIERGARHIHHPLMASDPAAPQTGPTPENIPTLAEVYTEMVASSASMYVGAIELLADTANTPSVFHCAAGKDRTGTTAAIIYTLLGVDRAEIVSDYVLTEVALKKMMQRWIEQNPEIVASGYLETGHANADPESIITFLDAIETRYGSVEAWLLESGMRPDSIDALRANMLD